MARFLSTVWPVFGHLHPNLAVAIELRARGHEVAFYTGGTMRSLIEDEGFRVYPFKQLDEARVLHLLETIGARSATTVQFATTGHLWREWLVDTVPDQLADLQVILDDWQPDAIICDPGVWAPILILHESIRIPVAVFSYFAACIIPGPDAPLLGWSIPRPRHWYQRLKAGILSAAVQVASGEVPRAASHLRRRYGLPPLKARVIDYASQMPLYLQNSFPEFDYQRSDLPPSVHYVGPCMWDRAANASPPAFLSELPRDRPWIYVTDGTMHFQKPLIIRAALEGLADLPVQVIVTSPKKLDPAEFGVKAIPANARIEKWIPHSDLFPLVDVIATTGGAQTSFKAIRAGVPHLVVPTAWDQGEQAWRVVEAGIGRRLSPRECTPARVREAILRLLHDTSIRDNLKRLDQAMSRHRGPAEAADLLEQILKLGVARDVGANLHP